MSSSVSSKVDNKSLLFDLCDNLRTPFVPRIQLLADYEDAEDDEAFGNEPNGDGLNGYMRMRMCDFIREYVGGSKPAILRIDDDLLTRRQKNDDNNSSGRDGNGDDGEATASQLCARPNDPANFPQPPQLGVFDDDIDKYHWAVRWHCNEYLVQKVMKGCTADDDDDNNQKGGAGESAATATEPNVTVALTPNGRADAITRIKHYAAAADAQKKVVEETYFASAAEVKMPMSHFFELLAVAHQNDADNDLHNNMTTDEEEASMGPKADYHRYVDLVARCAAIKEEEEKAKKKKKEEDQADGESDPPSVGGDGSGGGITYYNPTNNTIPYIQLQNSSLNTEYGGTLHNDVPAFVKDVGARLFGHSPDAENLWIGSKLSTTTMHQDWYENLYWVVRGTKTFTLIPPWEAAYLQKRRVKSVAYVYEKKQEVDEEKDGGSATSRPRPVYTLQPVVAVNEENVCNGDDGLTEWISTDFIDDPAPVGGRQGDTRHQCHPATASVHSGEVLYLPAMWFHGVEQTEEDDEAGGDAGDEAYDSTDNGTDDEEEEEENGSEGGSPKAPAYHPKGRGVDEEDEKAPTTRATSATLSEAAAAVPCVIAVNYWFEMHCGGPLFWLQEMLKNMFPQPPTTSK